MARYLDADPVPFYFRDSEGNIIPEADISKGASAEKPFVRNTLYMEEPSFHKGTKSEGPHLTAPEALADFVKNNLMGYTNEQELAFWRALKSSFRK